MQLDIKGAANIFGVSEKTVQLWIKQKSLPACQVSGEYRFNRAELLEWATERKVSVSSEILSGPAYAGNRAIRLDEALRLGGVFHRVEGTDSASVLRAVVDLMPMPADVDRTFLYEMLFAREALGSTAIGDSIAIPHVRHPIVLHLPHPTITLCFLEHPIDFGAMDGLPVAILFMLASPTVRAHQLLLSKLASALKDPLFKALLTRKGSCEEILRDAVRVEETLASPSPSPHP
ncbi:MAG: PTS sugar transporter subunit IIA [Syntrophobacteraceae bacterium]